MKTINLNKIIRTPSLKPRGSERIKLDRYYPVHLEAEVFRQKKQPSILITYAKEENLSKLRLFAKAVFTMYRIKYNKLPNRIVFLLNKKGKKEKIEIRPSEVEHETLNGLLNIHAI